MHGPTCIFWANLTPFSLEVYAADPSRALDALTLTVDRPGSAPCVWVVHLPTGGAAGSSVGGKLQCG